VSLLVRANTAWDARLPSGDAFTRIALGAVMSRRSPGRPVWLERPEQRYHGFLLGTSGSGKSSWLEHLFLAYFAKGKTVGGIDPHDLSLNTLYALLKRGYFRDRRAFQRLVYIDWGSGWYVPFNVLKGRGSPQSIALNCYQALLRVYPELQEAPAFRRMFLAACLALIANGLTLKHLHTFFADEAFRRRCLGKVEHRLTRETFALFERWKREQPSEVGSLLRRIFAILFEDVAAETLGHRDNLLDFRAMMDRGQSFLISLSNIGDDETRRLIGAFLMVAIEQAALSRRDLPQAWRDYRSLHLLVDEWPSFAAQAQTIGNILDLTRKYGLRLYLSSQRVSQFAAGADQLLGALENCDFKVAFRLGHESAEVMAPHFFDVDPYRVKALAPTEEQHHLYLSVQEQRALNAQILKNLPHRVAVVKLPGRDPIPFYTPDVPPTDPHDPQLLEVLRIYRRLYQVPASAVAPIPQFPAGGAAKRRDDDALFTWGLTPRQAPDGR
jgi:hypothetical protein